MSDLSDKLSNGNSELEDIVSQPQDNGFFGKFKKVLKDKNTYKRLVRAATLGTAVGAAAVTGGLAAAAIAGTVAIGAGYAIQYAGNKLAEKVGEEYAGAVLGTAAAGMRAARGDYIGVALN